MRKAFATPFGASLMVTATLLILMLATAEPSAQRRDNATFGAPIATNTILQSPDEYYGKLVTISAGVEGVLSRTAFLVDQRRAAGPGDVKAIGKPILVLAPYLTAPLAPTQKGYLLLRGQIVKLDAAAIARVAEGYTLDLAPEVIAKYQGQPILVATSVLDNVYAELGRKPLPPPSAIDVSLSAAMKTIAPAVAALRTAVQESKADAVAQNATALAPAFTQVEAIFDDLGQSPAAQWAREGRAHVVSTESAAAAGNWDAARTSAAALNQVCGTCHAAYRQRQEDGTFRIMPGSF